LAVDLLRELHVAMRRAEKNENQPRRNEGREDFFYFFLRSLRFFAVIF
jgi:hypothetical protein